MKVNAPRLLPPRPLRTAVILLCHPGYLKFLPSAIETIQRNKFSQFVLVFDMGTEPCRIEAPRGWTFVTGHFRNPNLARNAGLAALVDVDWVCYWDADNPMPENYLAAALKLVPTVASTVAVLYPGVEHMRTGRRIISPGTLLPWDRLTVMEQSLTDTASFWRVSSLQSVGGWNPAQVAHDDFELALRLSRHGWTGQPLGVNVYHHDHGENRSNWTGYKITQSLWTAYSFAFVTLWSGKSPQFGKVLDWLANAEIPPQSSLYWVDNSGGKMTRGLQEEFAAKLSHRFRSLHLIQAGEAFNAPPSVRYLNRPQHTHVASLYNLVFPRIAEEVVCVLEDDMVPPHDGVRRLLAPIFPGSKVAVASSVYRARHKPEHACCSRTLDYWGDPPLFDRLPGKAFRVGMTGGGFALLANWVLQRVLPMRCEYSAAGSLLGWDGHLGLAATKLGYKLLAEPSCRAEHLCDEVLAYLAEQKPPAK